MITRAAAAVRGILDRSMAGRAVVYEARIWINLLAWATRRPLPLRPGESAFPYSAAAAPLIWVFAGMSAVEIPIIHFVIPWLFWRVVALIAGAWGVLWMVGYAAAVYRHPHLLSADELRIRAGLSVDLPIPLEAIAAVRSGIRNHQSGKKIQYLHADGRTTVQFVVASQTNVQVVLREPLEVEINRRRVTVSEIHLFADRAATVARAIREVAGAGSDAAAPS